MPARLGALALLLLSSCDDHVFGSPHATVEGSGWCAVEQLIESDCVSCHAGSAAAGQLDLSVDPHAAIVGIDSALYPGQVLVTPGDPDASLLYTKMTGAQPAEAGGTMPPTGSLGDTRLQLVRDWVVEGAPGTCTDGGGSGSADGGGGADEGSGSGRDTGASESGWCGVLSTFGRECLACHSAASAMGGLDLQTDAHAALVDVTSAAYGVPLVAPGDRHGSLLWRKLTDNLASGEGGVMPPSGVLDARVVEAIGVWIDSGAGSECDDPPEDSGISEGYHPAGWADPSAHGDAAKHGELPCISCHGDDLSGDLTGVSCDSCHEAGWRTDCTFCHGGTDNSTGAPPRDIDGDSTASRLSFQAHTAHVTASSTHAAFDCSQCHLTPTDVLSLGHVLRGDTTPGQAELSFGSGLSPAASWSGMACSNLYCHGYNGADNGQIDHTASPPSCGGCHAGPESSESDQETRLSGEHEEHLDRGARCSDCHSSTVDASGAVTAASLHVNGQADVLLPAGMSRSGTTCTGTCHIDDRTENHSGHRW